METEKEIEVDKVGSLQSECKTEGAINIESNISTFYSGHKCCPNSDRKLSIDFIEQTNKFHKSKSEKKLISISESIRHTITEEIEISRATTIVNVVPPPNDTNSNKKKNSWEHLTKKPLLFIKCYIIPHMMASIITILVIIFQSLSGKGCFLPQNCLCNNNIPLKVRDALKDFFFFYVFLTLISVGNTIIQHKSIKILILGLMLVFLIGYYILIDEKMISDIYIYVFLLLLKISAEIYYLRISRRQKLWSSLFKLNIVFIVVYANYIFYSFFLNNMKKQIITDIPNGRTLEQFVISSYIIVLTFMLWKVHLIYADLIYSNNENDKFTIFLSSTMMLSYLFGIPASNVLSLTFGTVESYFWLISYSNVLTTNFLNINILKFIFLKLKNFLCYKQQKKTQIRIQKTNSKKNNQNEAILNLISETTLDMIFVTSIRPLILYYSGKWMGKYGNSKLFKNCEYDYDPAYFVIEPFGLFSIIFMNFFVVGLICLYSIVKKNKILHYRNNFSLSNIYILFLMHSFYEASLTVFY